MELIAGRYKIIRTIGTGTSGKALYVEDVQYALQKKSGHSTENVSKPKRFVLKEIHMNAMSSPRQRLQARKEILILSKLSHPNIIKYYQSFEEKDHLYIAMEYGNEGDLYSFLKNQHGIGQLREGDILDIFIQLCLAVEYLHDRKILHRDIKTKNIFITDNAQKENNKKALIMKLGDFGISRFLIGTAELAHTAIGTPYYLSPEICESKPYSYASDIWALGCVLYELITFRHAFDAQNMKSLILKIVQGQYTPIHASYSKDLISLVDHMLNKEPIKRPSIKDILELPMIQHALLRYHPNKLEIKSYVDRENDAKPDRELSKKDRFSVLSEEIEVAELHDKFNSLMKSFGEEQAFSFLVHWLLGPVNIQSVLSQYKWNSEDSYADIIEHIQWVKRHENKANRSIPNGDLDITPSILPETPSEDVVFSKIDDSEYFLQGQFFKYNVYRLPSLLTDPKYIPSSKPANSPNSTYYSWQILFESAESPYEKLSLAKDTIASHLGPHSYKILISDLANLLKQNLEVASKYISNLEPKFHVNEWLTLACQVIANENNLYPK